MIKKLLTFCLLSVLCHAAGWGADETITFSQKGYSNGQVVSSVSGTDFTITFSKGSNSTSPAYYSSGSAIRVYGGNTFTVASSTKTIKKIELTFGSNDGTNAITTDVGTYSSGTWTGSASSVAFTVGGTSGNRRLAAVAVTYDSSSPTPSTSTTTYNFNTIAGLQELGINVPASGQRTSIADGSSYTANGVSLTFNNPSSGNGNNVYYYNGNIYELCIYRNSLLTFSAPSGSTITSIVFEYVTNYMPEFSTVSVGVYSNGTWTGEASSVTFTSSKTSYILTITVTYTTPTTPSYDTVIGIDNFKKVTAGTTVQLYLPDGNNARVTHVEINGNGTVDAYVRDNTGAMRMTGISPSRNMAYNQHLAGWITGQYTLGADGIPQFKPTDGLTNTDYLVIADPVTESDTEPVVISSNATAQHLGDWVAINEVAASDLTVDGSKFNLDYYTHRLYNDAIIDINGIVAANGKIYPVDDQNNYPITYVVDAEEGFSSPTANIENTQVRLKRSFTSGQWQLLTVPFDIDVEDLDGEVLEYTGVRQGVVGSYDYNGNPMSIMGGVMVFENYSGTSLHAGTPYLVKFNDAPTNMTFTGVTLSNAQAGTITKPLAAQLNASGINLMANEQPAYVGDYSLVGTYSPQNLNKDTKTVVLLDNGNLSWTSLVKDATVSVAGTEGYITIPEGAGVALDLGTGNGIITGITTITAADVPSGETVIYNLMGVRLTRPLSELPPGIYIVNGKKIVK